MTFKFLDFQIVFIKVLSKIKSNCMSTLFCIANLFGMGRRKHFLKIYGF